MPVVESFLCFLDVETSGLAPGRHEVCEIASIMTDLKLREVGRIELKVQLQHPDRMSPEAAAVNGYTPEVWAKEAKPFQLWKDWLRRLLPRPNVAIPVGHNAKFDREMIAEFYYVRQFFPLSFRPIDTVGTAMSMKIAGIIQVSDVRLETVKAALGIKGEMHRAMSDCEASKMIFEKGIELMKWGAQRIAMPVPLPPPQRKHEESTELLLDVVQPEKPEVKLDPRRPTALKDDECLL